MQGTSFSNPPVLALSSSSFLWPKRIVGSNWLEHGPFAFWLVEALAPESIVELGIGTGFAYFAICQAIDSLGLSTRCQAFDITDDSAEAPDGGMDYAELQRYNSRHYASFSTLVRSSAEEARLKCPRESIDLLHINSAKDGDALLRDIERWLPAMSSNGVVLIDNVGRNSAAGISEAWEMLAKRFLSFEFTHSHGLGVLAIGSSGQSKLADLFDADPSKQQQIRRTYARLGRAVTSRWELSQAADEVESINESKKRLELEIAALQMQSDAQAFALHRERERAIPSHGAHSPEALREAEANLAAIRNSTAWRLTAPLRLALSAVRDRRFVAGRATRFGTMLRQSVREHGWSLAMKKGVSAFCREGFASLWRSASEHAKAGTPYRLASPRTAAHERLALRVLLIAETSIPQCLKYRVTQKQRMIQSLGVDCTVVNWTDAVECRNLLQTHSLVIFYRVPAFPEQLRIIKEAKGLGVQTAWEVDDLIFDADKYGLNSNLAAVSVEEQKNLLEGVVLYRAALLACDFGIASTTGLADAMREAGVSRTVVIENALDEETMRLASKLRALPSARDGLIRIAYGSGTKTHDADFLVVANPLLSVLRARPNVRLRVIGVLNLPIEFDDVEDQIERFPLSSYDIYLTRLSQCDINIAPLEDTVFNDAKSNIKYLEASILNVSSVCSPRAAFRTSIQHGNTGYLASVEDDWYTSLITLVDSPEIRGAVATRAFDHVLSRYDKVSIAREQVTPLLRPFIAGERGFRVLGANVFFEPRSFGGATVIAEEMARRLNARSDVDYFTFTSMPVSQVPPYRLVRYETEAGGVFGMGLPDDRDAMLDFENAGCVKAFTEAIRAVKPDVVHLHSIQKLGILIAEVCRAEKVPFIVTLHDAWWICGRQFMITGEGRYCNQSAIDLDVCARCVDDAGLNAYRQYRLRQVLQEADLLLAPSAFFRGLFIANNFDAQKLYVNKNGISPPKRTVQRKTFAEGRPIRFGYVGGETPIKGAHLIRKVFGQLKHENYELTVVDNLLNLGSPSINPKIWSSIKSLKVVAAYTQETIEEFFDGIDVLLFPTQWKESFGLTVREALARDVWVITTDAGGAIEDVKPGENGDIIPLDDNGGALEIAVVRLLDNPMRLQGFENPHKSSIRLFDEQADELYLFLRSVSLSNKKSADLSSDGLEQQLGYSQSTEMPRIGPGRFDFAGGRYEGMRSSVRWLDPIDKDGNSRMDFRP